MQQFGVKKYKMTNNRIQLSGKDILEKNFKSSIRGYNQEDVDQFLDVIIQDYEAYQREIENLKNEVAKLKNNKGDNPTPQKQSSIPTGQINYDIIKRLSNLEKAVFGKSSRTT